MRIGALLIVLAVVLAGCGSSSSGHASAPKGSVVQVGKQTVTVDELNGMLASAKQYYASQKKQFPKAGTKAYNTVHNQAVEFLIQGAIFQQEADRMGVGITDKKLDSTIATMKQQNFGGSEKKLDAAIAQQGLTKEQFRTQERIQLAEQALQTKVANGAQVSDAQAKAYWEKHKGDYKSPASRTVRHILVAKKSLADNLYARLKSGASFTKLVSKYSTDTGSKSTGGKLTDTKGSFVPEFEKVAFALKTNEISKPVHSQYGWHIIQALGPIQPAKVESYAQASSTIKQALLGPAQQKALQTFTNTAYASFCKGQIAYGAGYHSTFCADAKKAAAKS
ncbi:MAG TPA: peptidylprolyl isomerase [Gaiellaceae bacterium]|nr:peptidylprolyl isomerase [Gaiellaceae bacterium]